MKWGSWIAGVSTLAAGAFLWRTWGVEAERGATGREPHPTIPAREPERMGQAVTTVGERTAVLPQPGNVPEGVAHASNAFPADPRPCSPLARSLDEVAASFLTELPRVTDLLPLVGHLASLAVIDPDSVNVVRNPAGDLVSARGALAIDDLRGRFLIDQDGIQVAFTRRLSDGPWDRYDLLIGLQEEESVAGGCHATVSFHLEEGQDVASHQGHVLTGWAVGTDPVSGTLARPLTMTRIGDTWRIGGSENVQPQEFALRSSYSAGFDAWLRLLKSCTSP